MKAAANLAVALGRRTLRAEVASGGGMLVATSIKVHMEAIASRRSSIHDAQRRTLGEVTCGCGVLATSSVRVHWTSDFFLRN